MNPTSCLSRGSARILAALLLLAWAGSLSAQRRIAPGERVRAVAPTLADTVLVGTVAESYPDTLLLYTSRRLPPLALPLGDVTQLEVSRGRRHHGREGLILGTVLGGLVAGLVARGSDCSFVCGPAIFYSTLGGAVGGGLGGYLVGSEIREGPERWRPVPLRERTAGPDRPAASATAPTPQP